jgi:hypothetical protein
MKHLSKQAWWVIGLVGGAAAVGTAVYLLTRQPPAAAAQGGGGKPALNTGTVTTMLTSGHRFQIQGPTNGEPAPTVAQMQAGFDSTLPGFVKVISVGTTGAMGYIVVDYTGPTMPIAGSFGAADTVYDLGPIPAGG